MSTETSTPTVEAPADGAVESASPTESDDQPSTQLESARAVPSESASTAVETMSQVHTTRMVPIC